MSAEWLLAGWRAGEEQVVPGVLQGEGRLEVGDAGDLEDLVDAFAAAWAGAGEDHPPNEVGGLQGDHLGDPATEREPEQADLLEADSADERDGVAAHVLDGVRDQAARRADAAVVEGDDPMMGSDAVDHSL